MRPEQLKTKLSQLSPGTQVEVMDLTGTEDHYQAILISPAFLGQGMLQQHRLVYALVQEEMDSGEIHALSLKTFSPDEAQKQNIILD